MKRLLMFLFLFAACGDPLVEGSYEGEPRFRVEGVFRGSTGGATIHNPKLGIIWGEEDVELEAIDTILRPIEGAPLSNSFSFEIWDLPPESAFFEECGARIAMGSVAVYDDVNGDGRVRFLPSTFRFEAPDLALGVSRSSFLLYTDAPLLNCRSLPLPSLGPGFHVLQLHNCELWRNVGALMEVELFPPSNTFPALRDLCPIEPA